MAVLLKRLYRGEEGAGLVEYALLVVLIALLATIGMRALGVGLNTLFSKIGSSVSTATVPSI